MKFGVAVYLSPRPLVEMLMITQCISPNFDVATHAISHLRRSFSVLKHVNGLLG